MADLKNAMQGNGGSDVSFLSRRAPRFRTSAWPLMALFATAGSRRVKRGLVFGATGGVGSAGIQLGKALGARVIAASWRVVWLKVNIRRHEHRSLHCGRCIAQDSIPRYPLSRLRCIHLDKLADEVGGTRCEIDCEVFLNGSRPKNAPPLQS
jgi:hypothetical protein